jgi:uncharacterized OsmC-like protein
MHISAVVKNEFGSNEVQVSTNGGFKKILIPPKENGQGSSVNGGELLALSLAVCYCNDIYREAAKRNIEISGVDVEVTATFGAEGEAGSNFQYKPVIRSNASPEQIAQLILDTDSVAEIHNTLRNGVSVRLT